MSASAIFATLWLIVFAIVAALICPLMLRSGNSSLTLLAFVAPCLWVLASVVLYIAWADSGWREEWESHAPAETTGQAGAFHHHPSPRIR